MEYEFINPNKHAVVVLGPNKEKIEFKPRQKRRLSAWYQKYCPKYLSITDSVMVPKKIKAPQGPMRRQKTRPGKEAIKPPEKQNAQVGDLPGHRG